MNEQTNAPLSGSYTPPAWLDFLPMTFLVISILVASLMPKQDIGWGVKTLSPTAVAILFMGIRALIFGNLSTGFLSTRPISLNILPLILGCLFYGYHEFYSSGQEETALLTRMMKGWNEVVFIWIGTGGSMYGFTHDLINRAGQRGKDLPKHA